MNVKVTLFILLTSLTLIISSCKDGKAHKVQYVELISVLDMEEALKIDDVQLVDVRTKKEFASGHIRRAKNIVYQSDDWDLQVASLDKDKPVYVYCAKGVRSAKCASILEESGFTKIFDLEGGVTKWINEGKGIE